MNNRQSGRRRGRNNNQRQPGQGRNVDQGNRIDSRARGNAAQMLEKYRNMARDAQMSGDRVMMEYYLQFADHYFRVLSDSRSRQEEQRSRADGRDDNQDYRRDGDSDRDDGADGERHDTGNDIAEELDDIDTIGRAPRNRDSRNDSRNGSRNGNQSSGQNDGRNAQRSERRDEPAGRAERISKGRNGGNGDGNGDDDGPLSIDAAILPPAIGLTDTASNASDTDAPAPVKRRPRARKAEPAGDSPAA